MTSPPSSLRRRTLATIGAVLIALPVHAQFDRPPNEAFGLGLVLAYDHGIIVERFRADIRQPCDGELGCFKINDDGTCTLMIDLRAEAVLYEVVFRHLVARCAGWEPE